MHIIISTAQHNATDSIRFIGEPCLCSYSNLMGLCLRSNKKNNPRGERFGACDRFSAACASVPPNARARFLSEFIFYDYKFEKTNVAS